MNRVVCPSIYHLFYTLSAYGTKQYFFTCTYIIFISGSPVYIYKYIYIKDLPVPEMTRRWPGDATKCAPSPGCVRTVPASSVYAVVYVVDFKEKKILKKILTTVSARRNIRA
jgi:hypothetical protein